jgi:hypothetical protein
MVELSTPPGREAEWNRWYHEVHIPELQALAGAAVRSTRYRVIAGPDEVRYVVMHEFADERQLRAYLDSPVMRGRKAEYAEQWGAPEVARLRALVPVFARDRDSGDG